MTLFDFQQHPSLARLALPVRPEPKTSPPDCRQLPAALTCSAGRPGDLPSCRGGQRAPEGGDHRPYPSRTGQDAAQREFPRVSDALDGITLQRVAESWSWAEMYTVDLGEVPVVAAVRWRCR